jgi:hypothetical protein
MEQDNGGTPHAPRGWRGAFRKNFSGPPAGLALGALSAWMILPGSRA